MDACRVAASPPLPTVGKCQIRPQVPGRRAGRLRADVGLERITEAHDDVLDMTLLAFYTA